MILGISAHERGDEERKRLTQSETQLLKLASMMTHSQLINNADEKNNLRYQTPCSSTEQRAEWVQSSKFKVRRSSKFRSSKKFKVQEKRLADPVQIGRAIRSVIIELIELVASNFTNTQGRQAEAQRQQLVISNS